MAAAGVEYLPLTRFQTDAAGIPPSLANAKIVRELQVTAERPQNHIAIAASPVTTLPARAPSALSRMAITAGMPWPSASRADSTDAMSLMASVNAISKTYPTIAETATAITMPHGTRRLGSTVSSD